MKNKISVDFRNTDKESRLRLGTEEELGVKVSNGLLVTLCDGNQEIDGILEFSGIENIWVARVNWFTRLY